MTTPRFPAVDRDGKIQEAHLPSRLSESELVSLIQSESSGGGAPDPTDPANKSGLEMLATKLAFGGAGQHTVAVVADSTMNDGNDSLRIFDRKYSAELPDSVRHVYHNWNTAENGWRHATNSEGDITPGHDGTVIEDSFSRVATDLVGNTPDTGVAWSGSPGTWSSNGTEAKASGLGALSVDAGVKNMVLESTLNVNNTALESAQSFRYYLGGASAVSEQGIMLAVNISNTGGLSFTPYLNFGNPPVRFGDILYAPGVTNNSPTTVQVTVRIEIDIQNITITVTGPTGDSRSTSGVITEEQYAQMGTWAVVKSFNAVTSGLGIDHLKISTAPQPPQGDTLDVWNGAIAGGRWTTFNTTKLTEMFGEVDVDVLILSMGHNNGAQTGEDFAAEIEAWISQWVTLHPETKGIIWVSQNPQFPPATSPTAHRDRQMAIRLASKELGLEYVSGYEAFSVLPDGGLSLVNSDGIHPTTPSGGAIIGDFGSVLMADTIMNSIQARI